MQHELVAFREEHGTFTVPSTYTGGRRFARFASNMRGCKDIYIERERGIEREREREREREGERERERERQRERERERESGTLKRTAQQALNPKCSTLDHTT